jgi:hypothetical protein
MFWLQAVALLDFWSRSGCSSTATTGLLAQTQKTDNIVNSVKLLNERVHCASPCANPDASPACDQLVTAGRRLLRLPSMAHSTRHIFVINKYLSFTNIVLGGRASCT